MTSVITIFLTRGVVLLLLLWLIFFFLDLTLLGFPSGGAGSRRRRVRSQTESGARRSTVSRTMVRPGVLARPAATGFPPEE